MQAGSTCSSIFLFFGKFYFNDRAHRTEVCIKFCQKLGDTQVETIRKIQQAFGNEALSPNSDKAMVQTL